MEYLALALSLIGKVVELGSKLQQARAEDAEAAKVHLEAADVALTNALEMFTAKLAANDAAADAALKARFASTSSGMVPIVLPFDKSDVDKP